MKVIQSLTPNPEQNEMEIGAGSRQKWQTL